MEMRSASYEKCKVADFVRDCCFVLPLCLGSALAMTPRVGKRLFLACTLSGFDVKDAGFY